METKLSVLGLIKPPWLTSSALGQEKLLFPLQTDRFALLIVVSTGPLQASPEVTASCPENMESEKAEKTTLLPAAVLSGSWKGPNHTYPVAVLKVSSPLGQCTDSSASLSSGEECVRHRHVVNVSPQKVPPHDSREWISPLHLMTATLEVVICGPTSSLV